jgi:hypothetical protein
MQNNNAQALLLRPQFQENNVIVVEASWAPGADLNQGGENCGKAF